MSSAKTALHRCLGSCKHRRPCLQDERHPIDMDVLGEEMAQCKRFDVVQFLLRAHERRTWVANIRSDNWAEGRRGTELDLWQARLTAPPEGTWGWAQVDLNRDFVQTRRGRITETQEGVYRREHRATVVSSLPAHSHRGLLACPVALGSCDTAHVIIHGACQGCAFELSIPHSPHPQAANHGDGDCTGGGYRVQCGSLLPRLEGGQVHRERAAAAGGRALGFKGAPEPRIGTAAKFWSL